MLRANFQEHFKNDQIIQNFTWLLRNKNIILNNYNNLYYYPVISSSLQELKF